MIGSLLELPTIGDRHAFNLAHWNQVCADTILARLEYRIETDQYGHILMTPPPSFEHSDRRGRILALLVRHLEGRGRARPEVPISTSSGVKAVDAAWISEERLTTAYQGSVLTIAPEICIEILSPSNTQEEIQERKRLYFEAGAEEVWICDLQGRFLFYLKNAPEPERASKLCPAFSEALS